MMAPIKLEDEAASRAKLVDSLSASYPSQALSKAFLNMDPDDSEGERDPLSSSCYAEIRLDKVKLEDLDSDDELTSLSWLQDTDLLRNIRMDSGTGSVEEDEGEQKENDLTYTNSGIYGVPHPPHVPYNPQKHVNSKPPYSFSCLIFMSIEDSPDKKLPVKDIYNWILTHFPYFQNAPTGWKNSVRHNLSLNKCFKKVEKDRCSNIGKGSLWMIDPDFRPNLLQALRKTPYHPYHQLQMFNNSPTTTNFGTNTGNDQKPFPLQPRYNVNTPSPHLFPFLSRRLAQSSYDGTSPSESSISVSDIDVANTLVSLKRAAESRRPNSTQSEGSRSRSPSPPEFGSEREKELLKQKKYRSSRSDSPIVCYALPSDDHAYCITQEMIQGSKSPESSIDEEYEFGNNDKSLSDDYGIYSESDYDEEGWSEEEELYNKEKMKLSRTSYHHHHHNNNNQKLPSQKPIIVKRGGHHYSSSNNNNNISKGSSPPLKIVTTVSRSTSTKTTQKKVQQSVLSSSSASSVSSSSRDEDEDMKLAEGANALLNLAGIKTAHIVPLRSISPSSNNVNNNNNNVLKKIDFASVAQAVATAAVKDAGKSGENEKDLSLLHVKEAGCASENSMELSTENSTAGSSSEEDKMSLVGVCGVPPLMEITSIKGEDNCQEEDMET